MKYIILQLLIDNEPEQEIPFIFPDQLVHSMVADQMTALVKMSNFTLGKKIDVFVISAGEFSSMEIGGGMASFCHGNSESIGVESRGEVDDKLIRTTDYGSCFGF